MTAEKSKSRVSFSTAWRRLNDPQDLQTARLVAAGLLLSETVLCIAVINSNRYVNIDYNAYMEQISLYLNAMPGERDYKNLIGETGPVVYGGGYIYLFTFLYWITNGGETYRSQIMYMCAYLLTQVVVLEAHVRSQRMPPWSLGLLCLSRRVHSICMLRMFNDCWAAMVAYVATLVLILSKPRLAVMIYSFAVSIKMNTLLMAPAVFIVLARTTTVTVVAQSVALGVALQLALGMEFLLHAPGSYITRAFDFSRTFDQCWSVNFNFLPGPLYQSKIFVLGTLAVHIIILMTFASVNWCSAEKGLFPTLKRFFARKENEQRRMNADEILFLVFSSNLIGIACARGLHFQFYVWYFHTLPFLLWSLPAVNVFVKLSVLLLIEISWTVFPAAAHTSFCIFTCHIFILACLLRRKPLVNEEEKRD